MLSERCDVNITELRNKLEVLQCPKDTPVMVKVDRTTSLFIGNIEVVTTPHDSSGCQCPHCPGNMPASVVYVIPVAVELNPSASASKMVQDAKL